MEDNRARRSELLAALVPVAVASLLLLLGHMIPAAIVGAVAFALVVSALVRGPVNGWFQRLGNWLAAVFTKALLLISFIVFFAPMGIWRRLRGRDPLQRARNAGGSYWQPIARHPRRTYHHRPFSYEPATAHNAKRRSWRRLWPLVQIPLAVFALNYLGGVLLQAFHELPKKQTHLLPAFREYDWAKDYRREAAVPTGHGGSIYLPWVGFGRADFHGEFINVERGVRRSYQPPELPENAFSVYFFGGSTMWGWNARDSGTIPSFFARFAERDGLPIRVVNRGEMSYVAYQESILLQTLVANGEKPDLVVFYDGFNDTWVARRSHGLVHFQSHVMGKRLGQPPNSHKDYWRHYSAYHYWDYAKKMAARVRLYNRVSVNGERGVRSPVVRLVQRVGRKIWNCTPQDPSCFDRAAKTIVERYSYALRIARTLGTQYGFETEAFWQPVLETRRNLPTSQFALRDFAGDADLAVIYEQAADLIRASGVAHIITDALDEVAQPVYTDFVHVTERGNEAIAQRIYDQVKPRIEERIKRQEKAAQ